jgi:hypothetical protein
MYIVVQKNVFERIYDFLSQEKTNIRLDVSVVLKILRRKNLGMLFSSLGLNFTNIFCAAFLYQSVYEQLFSTYISGLSFFRRKNTGAKAAQKMLVKLTPILHNFFFFLLLLSPSHSSSCIHIFPVSLGKWNFEL